jgi:hypothetical protein
MWNLSSNISTYISISNLSSNIVISINKKKTSTIYNHVSMEHKLENTFPYISTPIGDEPKALHNLIQI